jgi:hypothetical protein
MVAADAVLPAAQYVPICARHQLRHGAQEVLNNALKHAALADTVTLTACVSIPSNAASSRCSSSSKLGRAAGSDSQHCRTTPASSRGQYVGSAGRLQHHNNQAVVACGDQLQIEMHKTTVLTALRR